MTSICRPANIDSFRNWLGTFNRVPIEFGEQYELQHLYSKTNQPSEYVLVVVG
jgi:hypothetical protein